MSITSLFPETDTPIEASSKQIVIAYHSKCRDGCMAAYELWRYLKECNTDEFISPVLIPVNYGLHKLEEQKLVDHMLLKAKLSEENAQHANLIVVDFCFKVDQTRALADKFRTVLVLDHHKTAIEDTQAAYADRVSEVSRVPGWVTYKLGNLEYNFSTHNSGAAMAWLWCSHHAEVHAKTTWGNCPQYVLWTQDRDLWTWRLPETAAFAEGISLYEPFNPEVYHEVLKDVDAILKLGDLLLAKKKAKIELVLKHKWPILFLKPVQGGESVLLALFNVGGDICSDLSAVALAAPWRIEVKEDVSGLPRVVMCYKITLDRVHVSLRSKAPYDCSWIARLYGGGGHAQACGFETTIQEFKDTYLKTIAGGLVVGN